MRKPLLFALFALVAGCGPNVMEMRMAAAPPRPDNCELQFLQLKVEDLAPMVGTYEQLGSVVLMERGVQDPFQDKYKAIVRPRACAMGGEGVTILQQATTQSMMGGGSAVNYAVVRKRQAPGTPSAPTKF
ncbi:MAG: hypothetical protein QM820_56705 [Minicystis sp.]